MSYRVGQDYSMDEFLEEFNEQKPKEPSVHELNQKLSLYVHRWQLANRKIAISSYAAACMVGAFITHLPQDAAVLDYLFAFLQIGGIGLLGCVISIFITELLCMFFGGDDYSNGSPLLLFLSALILVPIVCVFICSANFMGAS